MPLVIRNGFETQLRMPSAILLDSLRPTDRRADSFKGRSESGEVPDGLPLQILAEPLDHATGFGPSRFRHAIPQSAFDRGGLQPARRTSATGTWFLQRSWTLAQVKLQ